MAMVGRSRMWVNHNQMKLMNDFFETSPAVQMCRNHMTRSLMSGGLRCERGGTKANADFDFVLQRYWTPFMSELYDCFLKWGFAVWSVMEVKVHLPSHRFSKKNKTTGAPLLWRKVEVPYVRPFGSFRVEVRFTEKAEPSYHLYSVTKHIMASSDEEDKTMFMFVSPRYRPTLDAEIRSPLMPLLERYMWMKDMEAYALRIEQTHANPPFICETLPDKSNPTDAVAIEMFGDGEALEADEIQTYARNKANMQHFNRQRNMCSMLNNHHPKDKSMVIDPFSGRVSKKPDKKNIWQDSVFLLPEGQKMAPPLKPVARPDLIEISSQFFEMVCATIGVPKSLMMQDRGTASQNKPAATGSMDMSYRVFARNVDATAQLLLPFAELVYTHIYGDKATFKFPFVPMMDVDQLVVLAELGLISRETLAKHMLAAVGLEPEEVNLQAAAAREMMTLPEHVKTPAESSK